MLPFFLSFFPRGGSPLREKVRCYKHTDGNLVTFPGTPTLTGLLPTLLISKGRRRVKEQQWWLCYSIWPAHTCEWLVGLMKAAKRPSQGHPGGQITPPWKTAVCTSRAPWVKAPKIGMHWQNGEFVVFFMGILQSFFLEPSFNLKAMF